MINTINHHQIIITITMTIMITSNTTFTPSHQSYLLGDATTVKNNQRLQMFQAFLNKSQRSIPKTNGFHHCTAKIHELNKPICPSFVGTTPM
jgi:hypothetical protein